MQIILNAFASLTTAVTEPQRAANHNNNKGLVTLVARQTISPDTDTNSNQPEICRNYNRFLKSNRKARKTATNASTAGSTSAKCAVNGAVKPSNIRKVVYHVHRVALHLIKLVL